MLAAFAAAAVYAAPALATSDRLSDAIVAALDTHPRLQQERAQLRSAREAIPLALAPYRPQLTLQASTARSDREAVLSNNDVIDDETSPRTYSLDARQVLWSGGRRNIALRRGVLEMHRAQAQFATIERDIIEEVASAYVDLLLIDETVLIEAAAMRAFDALVDAARAQLARGTATRTELAQAEARFAEARARFENARVNLTVGRARFERVVGFPAETLDWPSIDLPWTDVLDVIDAARDNDPHLTGARLDAEIARVDMMAAGRRNSPTVTLGLRHTHSENVSPAVVSDNESQVNLTLSLPLLTGGETGARHRQAIAANSASRLAMRNVEAEVELRATQIWAQVTAAAHVLDAQEQRRTAAELALQGIERGRSAGLWTMIDVLNATDQLLRARLAVIEARRDLVLSRVRLGLITGVLEY
ncbi:hypothetical protein GCM10007420_22190 [Glycocaulis albus]|uniref:TolC family protein n=1 Tax=Glycocaulis albus TaxID=1382801 RepID=A0ABQ1XWB8_9PROT|nr:hypothetical protein GCM10007420_22190 [Glycocaulis albus]